MEYNKTELTACTSILIGRKATIDGSTIIGRDEDLLPSWPKHFVVRPHKINDKKIEYVSKGNGFSLELPKESYKYTCTPEWDISEGLFEENGFNEFGVAMSSTESAYANKRTLSKDPHVEDGISEDSILTVVLPYVKSAREGIKRLGQIVEDHGSAEANGILFSDQKEVWYMEIVSGHHWVAMQIPEDSYAVVANQLSIPEINFNDTDNYMWSTDIEKFVEDNHLNPYPESFNSRKIFGTADINDEHYNTPRVWWGHKYLSGTTDEDPRSHELDFVKKPNRLLTVEDVKDFLSMHYQGTKYDPMNDTPEGKIFRPVALAKNIESHILQIRPNMPIEVAGVLWLALGVTAQSVYVPFYLGINDTPEEYKMGALPYDEKSAYWTFKLPGILVDGHYEKFGKKLHDFQKNIDITLGKRLKDSDEEAMQISEDKLSEFLTQKGIESAKIALSEYKKLAAELITESTDFSKLNYKTDLNL